MMLENLRFHSYQIELKEWSLVSVVGTDRESFFQGQVTNDLSLISSHQSQITARLNRSGKIQSFFFIAKFEDRLELLVPKTLLDQVIEDFNKFIIMEDVILTKEEGTPYLIVNSFLSEVSLPTGNFEINFYGLLANISKLKMNNLQEKSELDLEKLRALSGFPKFNKEITGNELLNETFLNEIAVSFKKGCFLGQETASKIENNRGAATFPVLVILTEREDLFVGHELLVEGVSIGKSYEQFDRFLFVNIKREYRIEDKEINFTYMGREYSGKIHYLPYFKANSKSDYAKELFDLGTREFQSNNIEIAIESFKLALNFDPSFSDAYEVIGVILGRVGKYQEAIFWMDQLLKYDESSVMAHTNKSLYLMKLGRIEEAEKEKSLATVKSFSKLGEEARIKKALQEEEKKKEAEILKREKMFEQVLEIDQEDTIALFGMADIFFHRKQFIQSIMNLERVIKINRKYSMAYLLLGKSFEALDDLVKAKEIYLRGIEIAAKNGDMMPANEMQARLNMLK